MKPRIQRLLGQPWIYLLFAALWLLPLLIHPSEIAYWRGAQFSDMMVSHWPNAYYFKRSLLTWGQFPLWNSQILSGAPFLADPLSGVWYLPNWLTLVIPIPIAFNLLLWIHLAWTGWGMYRLMQSEGLAPAASLVAALLFSGTPKFIAHLGLGHISLIFAVSWTPWILLVARRVFEKCLHNSASSVRWAALTGAMIGLVFLADPRWVLPLGMLVVLYLIRMAAHSRRNHAGESRTQPLWGFIRAGVIGILFAGAVASALGLPLYEFVRESTRVGLGASGQSELSMPPFHLIGILVPFLSQPEWLAYVGVIAIVLAPLALLTSHKGSWFWIGLTVLAWTISLGDHTPLYQLFSTIVPGADLLRVPPRFLFIAALGMTTLAGIGMDALIKLELSPNQMRRIKLSTAGLVFFIVLLAGWFGLFIENTPQIIPGVALMAILSFIFLIITFSPRWSVERKSAAWMILLAVDLVWVNSQLLEHKPLHSVTGEKAALARVLALNAKSDRIFSPSYSLPQETAARYGLQLADGVSPMQIQRYRDYMAKATGFSSKPYSVTLPPFPSGEIDEPWSVQIDAVMLGWINTHYIVAEYPIVSPGLDFEEIIEGTYLYRNNLGMPRAWIESLESAELWWDIDSMTWTPNKIIIQADGPGRLVLSEVDYPGWEVSVGGLNSVIEPHHDVLRSVLIPEGAHTVSFDYRPRTVYLGVGLSLLAVAALILLWLRR